MCGMRLAENAGPKKAGSELVRSWFEPDSVMEFGFEPVCDQLRTSIEPASVMEFGLSEIPIVWTATVLTLMRIVTLRLGTRSNVNLKYIEPMRKA